MNTTILIIFVVAVVFLGVVSIFVDVYKKGLLQKQLTNYTCHVTSLAEKLNKKEDCTHEAMYIIAHSPEVSKLFYSPLCPAISLSLQLSNKNYYGIEKLINSIGHEELQAFQRLNNEKQKLYSHLWNPVTLFFRGIGFILRMVFGYFIELFDEDFDYEGKVWKTVITGFGILTGVFTTLSFFGYDWFKLMTLFK